RFRIEPSATMAADLMVRTSGWRSVAVTLLLGCAALLPSSCAPRARTAVPPAAPRDAVAELRADLDLIFGAPTPAAAHWGVQALSVDRGQSLYERNPGKLLMPASNQKLLTAAAALVELGPEHRLETRVVTDGEVVDGTLTGNLVVVGFGDPTAAPRF